MMRRTQTGMQLCNVIWTLYFIDTLPKRGTVWTILSAIFVNEVAQICMDFYRDQFVCSLHTSSLLSDANNRLQNPKLSKWSKRRIQRQIYKWERYVEKGRSRIYVNGIKGFNNI